LEWNKGQSSFHWNGDLKFGMKRVSFRTLMKMAETQQTFEIVVLPKLRSEPEPEPKLLKLAEKFQDLRLKALRNAADAFASKYETESQDGIARAIHRLSNPKAIQFVALKKAQDTHDATDDEEEMERILASDWVGLNVLLGPEEGTELSVPSANLDPFPQMTAAVASPRLSSLIHRPREGDELHYHINGMYVDPSARGSGLGRKLMDAALNRAKAEAASAKTKLRVSLSVFTHNVAAKKLYEASGFYVLKEETARSREEFLAAHMEMIVATPS
jgi:ribosomal protein S18 acetylase RimI-like enzyme